MRSSFAKSIYVGAAVLGLAGLSAVTTTTASAKSYATAGAYTALADKSQNVTVTGTNAIYSKPGTVKGAKVVASKKTVAKLAASKKSSDTFYAYGTKTTNRGSVYYKIVTMDKKYRGYVYAGKTAGTFTAGIKAAETTTAATTPARTTGYYLKDVSKNTLWTAPKNTDIHAKKVSLYGAAKTDPFTVDKAETKTKEGSLYYHVTDSKDSSISGWIYAGKGYDTTITDNTKQDLGGLSLNIAAATATPDNSVNVVYRDGAKTVSTMTWVNSPAANTKPTKAGDSVDGLKNVSGNTLSQFVTNNVPANYKASNIATATTGVKFGNTIYVDMTAAATSKVSFVVDNLALDTTSGKEVTQKQADAVAGKLTAGTSLTSKDITATLSSAAKDELSGVKGTQFSPDQLNKIVAGITLGNGTKTYYASNGDAYHYTFAITTKTDKDGAKSNTFATDNRLAFPGDTLKASVTATLTHGAATTAASDNSWIA
ncbi:S-layer protein [Levilactobacillus brevis]|uniref:S-layer protein n=1 Tax=Levilactobacillus brevis TaxID=1580 RepID=UPI002935D6CA|nr:S-layer protein [Levilactobacillus brevis]MDV2566164.1 S-layer protein [Levilactobacillus brevis]MDV2584978.1 S-layer protein [Levilactobacillus brevis]